MKREDLFAAIGQMDESFLASCGRTKLSRRRPVFRRPALVAALIAALCITVAAAEGYWQPTKISAVELKDGRIETKTGVVEVYVNLSLNGCISNEIQTYYVPAVLNLDMLAAGGFQQHSGRFSEFTLSWRQSCNEYVTYRQIANIADGYRFMEIITGYPAGEGIHSEMLEKDSIKAFYVVCNPTVTKHGQKLLYWTDGTYLFSLVCPYNTTQVQMEEIVMSLTEVDDIQPYMQKANEGFTNDMKRAWSELAEQINAGENSYIPAFEVQKANLSNGNVTVDLLLKENAPETLERLIYPAALDIKEMYSYSIGGEEGNQLNSIMTLWRANEYGAGENIWFYQEAGSLYQNRGFQNQFPKIPEDAIVDARVKSFNNGEVFWVSFAGSQAGKYIYWTDGEYVFSMRCPYKMADEKIIELLESLDIA